VLPEAGKDHKGSELEVLETMKVAESGLIWNKVIDLKSKKLK
jgi:hypothetical protein